MTVMIIRDARTQDRFFVDNIIVDVYGPLLPKGGLAVYTALCRYADLATQSCYPSYQTIADKTRVSRPQVARVLSAMREFRLITWEQRAREDGSQTSNVYYLLDPPPAPPSLPDTPPSLPDTPPVSGGDGARLPQIHEQSSDKQSSDEGITPPSGSAAERQRMVFDLRSEYLAHHNEDFPEDAMRRYPEVVSTCVCGAVITQEMLECTDCHNEVVWLNSRIWRDRHGDPAEAARDTSWQEPPDDFAQRLLTRLKLGRFRTAVQAKKWARVRRAATDQEIRDAADYVIGNQRKLGYGGLEHIMNLALMKAAERPEELPPEEKPALEEHAFAGGTTYD